MSEMNVEYQTTCILLVFTCVAFQTKSSPGSLDIRGVELMLAVRIHSASQMNEKFRKRDLLA